MQQLIPMSGLSRNQTKSPSSLLPSAIAIPLRKSSSLNEHNLAQHNERLPPAVKKSKSSQERIKCWVERLATSSTKRKEIPINSSVDRIVVAIGCGNEEMADGRDLSGPAEAEIDTDSADPADSNPPGSTDIVEISETTVTHSPITDSNVAADGDQSEDGTQPEAEKVHTGSKEADTISEIQRAAPTEEENMQNDRVMEVGTYGEYDKGTPDSKEREKRDSKRTDNFDGQRNKSEEGVVKEELDGASKPKYPPGAPQPSPPPSRDSTMPPALKAAGLPGQASMVTNIRKWQLKSKDKTTPLKGFVKDKYHLSIIRKEWDNITIELPFPALVQVKKEAKPILQSIVKEYKSTFGANHKLTLEVQAKLEQLNDELGGPDVFV
ncbi:uncharacterized protein [Ptychodera flava]|uniref:uncharacterized protein isoform X2 n=1 Tax=Ptychodera flava TaxID=63121 RepID=UPI00396A043F